MKSFLLALLVGLITVAGSIDVASAAPRGYYRGYNRGYNNYYRGYNNYYRPYYNRGGPHF